MRIVFEEHGFPRELVGAEDRARAIGEGSIGPDTELTVYRDGQPPAVVRASAVDELRPLLGLPDLAPGAATVDRGATADEGGPVATPMPVVPSSVSAPAVAARTSSLPLDPDWIASERHSRPAQDAEVPVDATARAVPGRAEQRATKSGLPLPLVPFAKYAVFQGRASRAEFWQFGGLVFVGALMASGASSTLLGFLVLGTLMPSLAVAVRRLHDANITGWAVLTCIVPYVGWLILAVLLLLAGSTGANRHGQVPRGAPGSPI